jgi:hypothetical protein
MSASQALFLLLSESIILVRGAGAMGVDASAADTSWVRAVSGYVRAQGRLT